MNYMKQIAEMVGLELNEEFMLTEWKCKFRITETNLETYDEERDEWLSGTCFLDVLLLGISDIVKLPFNPKESGYYYSYCLNWDIVKRTWDDDPDDYAMKKVGAVFRTKEEALATRPKIYEKLTDKVWSSKNNG